MEENSNIAMKVKERSWKRNKKQRDFQREPSPLKWNFSELYDLVIANAMDDLQLYNETTIDKKRIFTTITKNPKNAPL